MPDGKVIRLEERHFIIIGNSGKGKTTLLREIFDIYPDIAIHINHNGDSGFRGRRVEGAGNLGSKDAIGVYENWEEISIDFHPTGGQTPNELLHEAIRFGKQAWQIAQVSTQITIDEAHQAVPGTDSKVPEGDPNLMAWVLHEGRSHGLKLGMATQDPRQMRPMYDNLGQLKYWCWVGPPAGFQGSFLDHSIANWLPRDKLEELDRFEYIVFDDEGTELLRSETDPDYGAL